MQGTHLFPSIPHGLLEQVDEVGRAELAQRGKRICAGINGLSQDLLVDSVAAPLAVASLLNRWGHELGNSWRNHCDKRTPTRGDDLRSHGLAKGDGAVDARVLAVGTWRCSRADWFWRRCCTQRGTMANGRGTLGELGQKPLPLWSSHGIGPISVTLKATFDGSPSDPKTGYMSI